MDTRAKYIVYLTHKCTLDAVEFGAEHSWMRMQGVYWLVVASSKDEAIARATECRSAAQ